MVTRAEADYEAVFRVSPALSILLATDFTVLDMNDSCLSLARRSARDVLGRCLFEVFPPNPAAPQDAGQQGPPVLQTSLERVLTTCRRDFMPLQRYDIEAVDRPGVFEERYWSTVNTPVLGPHGEVLMIVLTSEEVTDFVRALRRPGGGGEHGSLAQHLQTLNDQLRRAHLEQCETTSALREAVERQRRLVYDASHDLRNPITGLLAELEVALADPGTDLQRILRTLLRDAERLNDIVADLLDLARLDSETHEDERLIDLAGFVSEELDRHTPGAAVRTRLDPGVCVRASAVRLARLLNNLLANAERHARSTIEVVVTADPPDAVFELIDDGPGISPEDRERVFERGYRSKEASARDPGGCGLGLPIAREIAQEHGGRLYAAEHDGGARVVLRLPLVSGRCS
ncbi:PAS domain-containing sensor histidine kinase [Microbispora hainanensis]|uniref:PAS domain-containing sensor histidine kinase n=1 Tax=Microbispora hainanensis TaxID=568844 RepID=UPI00142EC142|nr:PAS domain-containing sensor histidine kinase [Microbispora hainanensis]